MIELSRKLSWHIVKAQEETLNMNVYEHGIVAESDEWGGSLRLVSSTDLPVYSGFSLTMVDLEGRSLNERAAQLGRVNGASCYPSDYFEESDVRYCVLATLYHLNRLIDLYVELTQLFEKIHPPGTASRGNTGDSRVYYELDAFLGAARRVYESIIRVLWKHYCPRRKGRWKSIRRAVESTGIIPAPFDEQLRVSWNSFGKRLADYRDCLMHNVPLTDGGTTCWMEWYGNRWGMNVKLPANPEQKRRLSFDFATGPEALSYCHTVACHLVDVCQTLDDMERVRHHLDIPECNSDRFREAPFVPAKLFDRVRQANYDSAMSKPVIIEDLPHDPEFERLFAQAYRNLIWFSDHAEELGVFKKYRGRYVASAGGELFVADSREVVERLAHEKHPDEMPHIRYILREKCDRIYSYQRGAARM